MKNIFIDTNVIIDFLGNRESFSNAATDLFDLYADNKKKLFVAAISYTNVYYLLYKQIKSHKTVISHLSTLYELTELIDINTSVINQSIHSEFTDFEDAVQFYAALSNKKIDIIVSRDKKGFKKSTLPVLDVEQAIRVCLQ
jgi:predicted nucleic acid-binding protein